jgi:hypothetical protein
MRDVVMFFVLLNAILKSQDILKYFCHLLRAVVYLGYADKYLGPLASRLREANQPVSRTPNRFLTPRPRLLA